MSSSAAPDKYFQNIPAVYLDQDPNHPSLIHPTLLHDSAAEAAFSGVALLDMNLRSYAYLGTGKKLFWDEERFERFKNDALALGHRVVRLSRINLKKVMSAIPKPCGILAANDMCAVAAFNAAATQVTTCLISMPWRRK